MLKRLNEKILNNDFFDKKYLQAIDIDELLDLRDNKEFDDEWVRVFEKTKEYLIERESRQMIKIKKLNIFVLNQEIRVENFNELYEVIYFIYSEKIKIFKKQYGNIELKVKQGY